MRISMYIPHQDWLLTGWTLNTWMSTRNGLAERDSRTSHNTFHAGSQSTLHILYAARPALHTAPSTTHSTFCSSRAIQATQFRSTLATLYIANPTPHASQSLCTSYTLLNARRNPDAGPPNSTLRATNSRPYYAPCSTLPTLPRTLYTTHPSHPGLQTPHFTRYTAKLFIPQASPASNSTLAPDAPDLPDRGMGGVILTGLSRPKPQQGQVA